MVRVVIIEKDGEKVIPVSHGTGFAVAAERIVTNAHVVREAREDEDLASASSHRTGKTRSMRRLVAVSARNDLALLATTAPMRLPPLTISGNPAADDAARSPRSAIR